ncbi:echinoderm microtubule-associated protein-like 3 isoform X5 [Canis lupus baileyi]|uniref:echinoderm microtubule-associated protein-like 3 isoform X5 n=1 Tax=Canis lupus familiaris TaxID=9615 RepID=UPI0018F73B8F|nr:echinoderm microtubule-associated protein-like 3 isoform X5 [Canis lupus familiaris]XP_038420212.1 echinoderm microtubule-associated protein-like 3 isoform X5 [Canis lupus familiaris]
MDGAGAPGEGPAQEALQSLSRRLQVQEKEMELVKAALAEALRLLRLQAPPNSLQDSGAVAATRDSSPAAPPGPPPPCSPALVSRGTQTEAEAEREASLGPSGLSNGPPAPQGGSEEPGGTQSEGGGSSSSGTGSPGPPGILRLTQPPQRADTPRRNSSSSSPSERPRQKLSRKAASSANLLLRSGSTESRGGKDPLSSPGGPGSRRSNYNLEGISVKMFLRGRPITMYIPSGIRSLEELPSGPPPETLSLDWVYGYRGRDSRSNLFVLRSGEVVYFIACVVVLYRPEGGPGGPGGGGQRHYRGHTDCVRCLAVHPDGVRVASGQTAGVDKDGKPLQPVVHVWDSETLLKLQEIGLGAFERGVGALAFSVADQGAFLCVVDDSNEHMLSVWDCSRGTKLAEIKSTNDSVLAVGFSPRDSSCIVTSGKSHVHFWNWSGGAGVPGNGTLTRKQGVFGKYKKPKFIPCFVFLPDGDILTGDSEGNILTWGRSLSDSRTPGRGGAKETYGIVAQAHAHEGSIFALCLRRDGTVLSGGGRDRRLVQWGPGLVALQEAEIPEHFGAVRAIAEGPGSQLLVGTTKNALLRGDLAQGFSPVIQGHTDELWGLCTHPFQNRFLTCGHDRQLCLWDGEGHALAWSIDLKETGLCADFHPSGAVVAVGLNTGRWLVLDTETREIVSDVTDGNEQLSVVRYSPDGLYLAIGSHDNMIYIYSVSSDGAKSNRFGRCVGHSSFITHLDWSKDGSFIMSNSGDYEILYWDVVGGCKLLRNRYDSRDREWATYTCVLGFHVYVPVRARQGAQPRVRRPRQPRDQRPVHARRLAPHLAGRQGRQHLPVASAGRRGRGASARHALANPLAVPGLLSRRLTAAGGHSPARGPAPPHPQPPGPGAHLSWTPRHSWSRVSLEGASGTPRAHCRDPLAEPGSPSLGPDSRRLLRGNKPEAKSPLSPFVGRGWVPPEPWGVAMKKKRSLDRVGERRPLMQTIGKAACK